MRATGSNDVVMADVFIPSDAVIARRPASQWHGIWDVILPIAMPIIVSCYVGLAESAYKLALESAHGKPFLAPTIGEINNEIMTAQLALEKMIWLNKDYGFAPSQANTEIILACKSIASRSVKSVVEMSSEVVGGAGFFKSHSMERICRDLRAMHFHPLPQKRQQLFSGRMALGLPAVIQV